MYKDFFKKLFNKLLPFETYIISTNRVEHLSSHYNHYLEIVDGLKIKQEEQKKVFIPPSTRMLMCFIVFNMLIVGLMPFFYNKIYVIITEIVVVTIIGYIVFLNIYSEQIAKKINQLEDIKEDMKNLVNPIRQFEYIGVDILRLEVGNDLIPLADPESDGVMLPQLAALRVKTAKETGYIFPNVRICDSQSIPNNNFEIYVRNKCVDKNIIYPDKILIYANKNIKERILTINNKIKSNFKFLDDSTNWYWLDNNDLEKLSDIETTILSPTEIIVKNINYIAWEYIDYIFSIQMTEKYVEKSGLESALSDVAYSRDLYANSIREILVKLLKDKYTINDIEFIMEKILCHSQLTSDTNEIATKIESDIRILELNNSYIKSNKF